MGTPRCYCFGWQEHGGHGLRSSRGSSRDAEQALPFAYRILDAGLLGPDFCKGQPEGKVRRVVIAGWTILTFWDRSGDSRPGSNTAFVLEGVHDFAAVIEAARQAFPDVFTRITFPLVPEEL